MFNLPGDSTHNFQSISLFFLQLQQKCVTFVTLLLFIQQPCQGFFRFHQAWWSWKHILLTLAGRDARRASHLGICTVFRRFAKNILETKRKHINYSWYYLSMCSGNFLGGCTQIYTKKNYSTMVATMTSLTHGWSFSVSVYSCPNKTRCCWCAWSENDANGQDGRHYQTGEPNVVDERSPLNNTGLQAQKTSQQYQYRPSISLGTWYWNSIKRPSSILFGYLTEITFFFWKHISETQKWIIMATIRHPFGKI